MTFTYRGFTFTFTLDPSGNVVRIDTPQILLNPPTTIAFNPSVPVLTAETIASALIDLLVP